MVSSLRLKNILMMFLLLAACSVFAADGANKIKTLIFEQTGGKPVVEDLLQNIPWQTTWQKTI